MRRDLSTTSRGALGFVIAAALFAVVYVGVTFAYGGYDDNYELVADFPRAGQGLANGSEVSYRGVSVGEVRSVELVDRQARVTLAMDPGFEVPVDARVVVRPKTVFGEKFVDLTFPEGVDGPYLSDGDTVENADSATEVEDFFEGSDNLFSAIDENELAELVTSLNESARGTGDDVARAFESSADASALGADTIDAQLRALDSFATFQDAIRSIGPDLNTISANNEIALGDFNANRPAFERVLSSLRPFAEDLAALLAATRPDIDTYLERGDSVVRLLTANEGHLTEVIEGLGQYVQAFGGGLSQERLPDGSGFAYFKNFIYLDDVEAFLCSQLADAPEEFGALRDALLSLQSDFDCSGFYDASPEAGPPAPAQLPSAARQAAAARRLVDRLYGLLGSPQVAAGPGPDRPARQPPGPGGGSVKRLLERLRRSLRSEGRVVLKLAVYSLGCLVVLGWLVSIVGNTAFFAERSGYEAELDDATGLRVNDAVKIAGVEVGAVTGIDIEHGHAVVSFEVDDGTVLPASTRSGIRWRSVLGQKYLYLYPGERRSPAGARGPHPDRAVRPFGRRRRLPQRPRPGAAGPRPRRRQRLRPGRVRRPVRQRGAGPVADR